MKVKSLLLIVLGMTCLGAQGAISRFRSTLVAEPKTELCSAEPEKTRQEAELTPDETAVKATSLKFIEAANTRDSKSAAALWTERGEFTDDLGFEVRGRSNLQKMYAETFAAIPKGNFTISTEAIRLIGTNIATTECTLTFTPADGSPVSQTKLSVLHTREQNTWLVASAKEMIPEDEGHLKLAGLDFLIGDWSGKRDARDIRISYTWGDGKAYIQSKFSIKEKDVEIASGIEIIAKDPTTGELRSWLWDRTGAIGEAVWVKQDNHWVIEANGTMPLGIEMSATNILIPLGKDTFTWQSVDRSAASQPLPNLAPLKITRLKK